MSLYALRETSQWIDEWNDGMKKSLESWKNHWFSFQFCGVMSMSSRINRLGGRKAECGCLIDPVDRWRSAAQLPRKVTVRTAYITFAESGILWCRCEVAAWQWVWAKETKGREGKGRTSLLISFKLLFSVVTFATFSRFFFYPLHVFSVITAVLS